MKPNRILLLTTIFLSPALAEPFWLSIELTRVDWRDGCLTTGGCSQPRFQILADLLPVSEKMSISWPVSEHFVQDAARQFVPHWPGGTPNDKTHRARRELSTFDEDEPKRQLIEVRGKCFNATLMIQKHTERCPWCPHPSEMTVIQQEMMDPTSTASLLASFGSSSPTLAASLLGLTAIAMLSSTAFACLLISYFRQRKRFYKQLKQPRFHPYRGSTLVAQKDDENRYDLPWEQTRPLTYWMGGPSKGTTSPGTTTSPLDSASSLPYAYRMPPSMPPPQINVPSTRIYHTIGNNHHHPPMQHDDSGLESV
ncbi:unnamed protein product, partial [Mesorhabditis spiculigera]